MRRARAWRSGSRVAERKVHWSQDAERDLEGIVDYIATENPLNALRVLDRLHEQARKLEAFPERGRRVPEIPADSEPRLRELVIASWRLIYAMNADTVLVVALVDCRRNIDAWLTQRSGLSEPPSPI